ncbi:unnamed protein product [Rhizophagus irregularis]|nr:unnamed protein product [Rhizophagus irregularis]
MWSCDEHHDIIKDIVRDKTINHLLTWLLEYNDNIQDFNSDNDDDVKPLISVKKLHYSTISFSACKLRLQKNNATSVLVQMGQFIFEEIFANVWLPSNNINRTNNNDHQYDALDIIHNYIYFGKNIIEFYTNLLHSANVDFSF